MVRAKFETRRCFSRPESALLIVCALGTAARIALAAVSIGTCDAHSWQDFGTAISHDGLLQLYRQQPLFNHPPLAGLWAMLAWRVSQATALRFAFVFKLPVITADAITCWLLYRAWMRRRESRSNTAPLFALLIAALFAWNLDAILVSGFHCNTDPIYAMLVLLSVYLVEARAAHFLAGLALGAAINVKLIPLIFIAPMLAGYRGRDGLRDALRFTAGLSIGAIPFAAVLLADGRSFIAHVINYSAPVEYWGVNYFLKLLSRRPELSARFGPILEGYHELGRYVIVLGTVLVALLARRRAQHYDRYTLTAVCAAIFLILAPGFGVQYTVLAAPLLLAVDPLCGVAYGLLAGIDLFLKYYTPWQGAWPIDSSWGPHAGMGAATIGLAAWCVLVAFVARRLARSIDIRSSSIAGHAPARASIVPEYAG